MNKVEVFKLINGEELISEVFNRFADHYELKNPATIMLQPTQNGQMGVGIAPYMPYVSGHVKLYYVAIAAQGEPDQSMTNEYNRIFGSGIEVVSASALAGLK
jgi:hypothetical protein